MNRLVIAAIALCCIALAIADDAADDQAFEAHVKKHGLNFPPNEKAARKALFVKRDRAIKQHNSNPKRTFDVGHNQLSTWTDEEREQLNGFKPPAQPQASPDRAIDSAAVDRAYATSIDYRTNPCMSSIRNQGSCGSCYAFALEAVLEFTQCVKNGGTTALDLSEQHTVSCCPSSYNCYGCSGGDYVWAAYYLAVTGGTVYESALSYTATTGTCTVNPTTATLTARPIYYNYMNYNSTAGAFYANADSIMQKIQIRPVLVALYASLTSFQQYKSGVYNDANCPTSVNHAVVVVGYGNDNVTGLDYWIVRNSWGSGWGASGYILVRRGVNMCGIETYAASVYV